MLVHALAHQLHDKLHSGIEKSSLLRRGYAPTRSSYPSELLAGERPGEECTEAAVTIVLVDALRTSTQPLFDQGAKKLFNVACREPRPAARNHSARKRDLIEAH
jgi:hypothetical protein